MSKSRSKASARRSVVKAARKRGPGRRLGTTTTRPEAKRRGKALRKEIKKAGGPKAAMQARADARQRAERQRVERAHGVRRGR